jgi:DivIVA domain-containing protein
MPDSNAQFRSVFRGYDPVQVDQHVRQLAQAAAAARQEAGERTIQVSKLEAAHGQLTSEVERLVHSARALEAAQMEAAAPTYGGLG